jgi:hypothetical protein
MLILHDEHAFCSNRKIFAILLVSSYTGLIDLEMCPQVIDLDYAQIAIFHNAAMRGCVSLQEEHEQTEKQANADDTVHNH